jgi:dCMP deaminase
MTDWDQRFLDLAKHVASWSKDPSTKVGAVIVDKNRVVIGLGYNGFPRGIEDSPERLSDVDTKYALIVHAETNAILNASSRVDDCTIYIWPFLSCNQCAKLIIQAGIVRVVAPEGIPDRWASYMGLALEMYKEAGVVVNGASE